MSKSPTEYKLEESGDTPFSYHITVIKEIDNAITDNNVQKYHFNLFRGILEKTATFLGYRDCYNCIVKGKNKKEIIRLMNLHSHGKLLDLESSALPLDDVKLFTENFKEFIKVFYPKESDPKGLWDAIEW